MKLFILLLALASAGFGWADAAFVSDKADDVEIVIYRLGAVSTADLYGAGPTEGLALITETREVDLPEGRSTVVFKRTAESMIPQTAKLLGLPAEITETNFDYRLLSPQALIESSIGKSVRVIRTEKTSGRTFEDRVILRSGPAGVLLEYADRTEALDCSGLAETLVFDELPPSLLAEPSLSMRLNAARAGRYQVRLSYLASGFDWSADYVARLGPDGRSLDLSGWITLSNRLSTSFLNAVVKVVAGTLSVDGDTVAPAVHDPASGNRCWPLMVSYSEWPQVRMSQDQAAAPPAAIMMHRFMLEEVAVTASKREAAVSELGDYKLYSLPGRTDLSANQTKQVAFVDKYNVQYERLYRFEFDPTLPTYNGEEEASFSQVTLKLKNSVKNGLGVPLPMGTVATFDVDIKGRAVFAGDQSVRDVAVDGPLEVVTGEAPDVRALVRAMSVKEVDGWWRSHTDTEYEVTVGNTKAVPVRLEIEFDQEAQSELLVQKESRSHGRRAGKIIWAYDLEPSQQEVLRLVLRRPR